MRDAVQRVAILFTLAAAAIAIGYTMEDRTEVLTLIGWVLGGLGVGLILAVAIFLALGVLT